MGRDGFFYHMMIFYFLFCSVNPALGEEFNRHQPSELPKLIAGYSAAISYADQFDDVWKSTNIFSKLNGEFEKLSCNIPVRIGFIKHVFIVQTDIIGYFSGMQEGYSTTNEDKEGILFISTPIKGIADKVLLILSSVSPGRVTIMLVDPNLNVELLYDTFSSQNVSKDTICFVSSVRVLKSGEFEIKEEIVNNCSSVKQGRTFLIDLISSTHFDMRERK